LALELYVAEKDIQRAILDYLRAKGYVCKRNNAGWASYTYKGKEGRYRVGESGWPDIECLLKDGRYCGIEVKSRKGVVSDIQKNIGERIIATQGVWFVARSLDDVIAKGL
jgi:hypothetical protein